MEDGVCGLHHWVEGAIHLLHSFDIPPRPIGANHAPLTLSLMCTPPNHTHPTLTLHTTIHFTHKLASIYYDEVCTSLLNLNPHICLSTLSTRIVSILHTSVISCFPHTTHTRRTLPLDTPKSMIRREVLQAITQTTSTERTSRDHKARG